jgi:hypothetical protein
MLTFRTPRFKRSGNGRRMKAIALERGMRVEKVQRNGSAFNPTGQSRVELHTPANSLIIFRLLVDVPRLRIPCTVEYLIPDLLITMLI